MVCDLPEYTPECNYQSVEYQQVKDHRVTNPLRFCTGSGVFLDPSNRSQYFDCVDIFLEQKYYLTIKTCPEGTKFNDLKKECDIEENLSAKRNIPGNCGTHNYTSDPYNCNKFYYCQEGQPFAELFCLNSHFFNGHFCQHKSSAIHCTWEELKKSFKIKDNY